NSRLRVFRSILTARVSSKNSPDFSGAISYTFSSYLLIAAAILSDAQLFRADIGFILPIISLNVPFLGFFLIAPLCALILQAYSIATSLSEFKAQSSGISLMGVRVQSLPFYLATPTTLFAVFWRLADYQS